MVWCQFTVNINSVAASCNTLPIIRFSTFIFPPSSVNYRHRSQYVCFWQYTSYFGRKYYLPFCLFFFLISSLTCFPPSPHTASAFLKDCSSTNVSPCPKFLQFLLVVCTWFLADSRLRDKPKLSSQHMWTDMGNVQAMGNGVLEEYSRQNV